MENFNWIDMMEKMQERKGSISPQEVDLLSRIILADAPLTPLELSMLTGLHKSAVSRLIESLESKEFLQKEYNQKDKRSYILHVTTQGNQELQQTYQHYLEPIYKLRRTLGEQRFQSLLLQIKEANRMIQNKEERK